MKFISILSIIFFCTFTIVHASEAPLENASYGDLFLAQKESSNVRKSDLSFQYLNGIGSPHYHLRGGSLRFEHWLHQNWSLGMSWTHYKAKTTDLHNVLVKELKKTEMDLTFISPQTAYFAHLNCSALYGLLRVSEKNVFPSDLILSVGAGVTQYTDEKYYPGIQISAEERIFFTNLIGAGFGLSQAFDRGEIFAGWLARTQLMGAVYVRF